MSSPLNILSTSNNRIRRRNYQQHKTEDNALLRIQNKHVHSLNC